MDIVVGCICLAIIGYLIISVYKIEREIPLEKETERREKIQTIFLEVKIGFDFSMIAEKFMNCEAISTPKLVSEVILENGTHRKVYIWYLDWDFVVSETSGVGVMPINSSTFNTGGNGVSFSNGTAASFTKGKTTQKAFIQMIFENDKLIAKEQQGLYQ